MRKILSFIVTCYLGVLLYFQSSTWGLAAGVDVSNIYDRGTGVLPFSLITAVLYFLYLCTAFLGYQQRNPSVYFNLRPYFLGFVFLFFVFVFFGVVIGEPYQKVITTRGLIPVVNMYLLMLVLLKIISTPNKLEKLTDLIVFCALTRGIWGLIRWAFLGGDPANIYATSQKIAVRLTFFDINDSLIATIGVFLAAWYLLYQKPGLTASRKLFYYLTIGIGLAVVLLSYRRTAWGGLVLAGSWLVWLQPLRKRLQVGLIIGLIGTLALPVLIAERFANLKGSGGHGGLLYDITSKKGDIATSEGRFSELNLAWHYISESPFTGVMPWGGIGLGGTHDFVHSGLVHLWLKGGIFALVLFCLILWNYVLFTRKVRREIPAQDRGLAEAAFAGLLFSMPNILFGTPFIEFRTTQLLGVLLILPYIVYGIKAVIAEPKRSPFALKSPSSMTKSMSNAA
ncbi:O-antigen ligase family protein [Methylomonas sp. BW4-1]|uniref:O-antigen ligase family protein n=1 Tax=Methylomonas sp. BW4-1 TaxID=3376685 RepID=UPI004043085A